MIVQVDVSKCDICGKCIEACPEEAITHEGDLVSIDASRCTLCKRCVDVCPLNAIVELDDQPSSASQAAVIVVEEDNLEATPFHLEEGSRFKTIMKTVIPAFMGAVIRLIDHIEDFQGSQHPDLSSPDHKKYGQTHNRRRRHGHR